MIAKNEVNSIEWCKSEFQFADYLMKGISSGKKLPNCLMCSKITIVYLNNY